MCQRKTYLKGVGFSEMLNRCMNKLVLCIGEYSMSIKGNPWARKKLIFSQNHQRLLIGLVRNCTYKGIRVDGFSSLH